MRVNRQRSISHDINVGRRAREAIQVHRNAARQRVTNACLSRELCQFFQRKQAVFGAQRRLQVATNVCLYFAFILVSH